MHIVTSIFTAQSGHTRAGNKALSLCDTSALVSCVVWLVALGLLTGADLCVRGLVAAGLATVDLATGGRVAVDLLAAAFGVTCLVVAGCVTARAAAGLAALDCCPALA